MGVPADDITESPDSNDNANSEGDFQTPGGVLRPKIRPRGHHKKLIISFDDTKVRFTGDKSDSNVAKIHRIFERRENDQVCFYRAWTLGTTLEEIVMDGYKFLMEHYQRDDVICLFGYSKGGYAALFLTNLIDYMGILVPGHDYMVSEVWRIFHQWMSSTARRDSAERREAKRRQFEFLKAFRESFVRPANEKLFFGVFDAVDLGLRMKYRSLQVSGQIVRHTLSIDEQQVLLKPLQMGKHAGDEDDCDLQEVWFPGFHQIIGTHF